MNTPYFNLSEATNSLQTSVVPSFTNNTAANTTSDPIARAKELLSLYHSLPNGMNFDLTKELSLECVDEILEHYFPDGEQRGINYLICNPRRNDNELGSFTINMDEGYWKDFADEDAKGGDLISLVAFAFELSQPGAAVKILEFIAGLKTDDAVAVVKRQSKPKTTPKSEYTAIMPIPDEAERSRPVFFGKELGYPTFTWPYRNAQGQVMFYVNRFKTNNGKSYMPLIYCKDATGYCQWKSMAPPAPRLTYGLDRLAARPEAIVIFNEGEKSADAAQRLFPEYVAVTTMNGAQSPEKTDFTPFAGRKVYIAPDNDEAGTAYKDKLVELLRGVGAEVLSVLRLDLLKKDGRPLSDGYDLADAEADGWTAEALAKMGGSLWEPISSNDILEKSEKPKNRNMSPLEKKAERFATMYFDGNLAYFNNQFLAYKDGYWGKLNKDFDIKKLILQNSDTIKKLNELYEAVRIKYSSKPDLFERKSGLTCLINGTLNPLTGELLPHSSNHHLTNKLDITFDLTATCPLWEQTLGEIFAPDDDRAVKIQLLQEFIGYCLIPDTRMDKFVWMIGPGGNGKSLILEIVEWLIGKANITNAHIDRFQDKYVRAELQGKLVNISSEMNADATVSDGYLKQIVTGDRIDAERKFEPPFNFKPYVRIFASTNKLPKLQDHSDGYARRAIFITFNRKFSEAEQDKNRKIKLITELPGILNWAIAGLQSLMQRGMFLIPASSDAAVTQYRLNSDPVRQFAETFLHQAQDTTEEMASGLLYERYRDWSSASGYKQLAINSFADRLISLGFKKTRRNTGFRWNVNFVNPKKSVGSSSIESFAPPKASNYDSD
jgi:putative DNA primase/helicase